GNQSEPAQQVCVRWTASLSLRLRPHSELIATWLSEMEPAATREGEDWLDHFSACSLDLAERSFKVVAVKDDEGASGFRARRQVRPEEAAIESLVRECNVVRTVILELPAKRVAKEPLRSLEISRGVLNVVDFLVSRHS